MCNCNAVGSFFKNCQIKECVLLNLVYKIMTENVEQKTSSLEL